MTITSVRQADAHDAVADLADRLADPHYWFPHGGRGRTRPQSLLGGAAGIALLHLERARSGTGDWNTARAWLALSARDALSTGHNATLFFGAPALGFLARSVADDPARCPTALAALDEKTREITRARLTVACARLTRRERPTLAEFDLFRGLAGFGLYHLRHHPEHDITRAVLHYLVDLTEPLPGDTVPGWWTDVAPHGEVDEEFPGGHGNLGMAHGIGGPLALLALALRRGVEVPGQREAIERICAWMDSWQQPGVWWPGVITRHNVTTGQVTPKQRQAPRWCYGTVGMARALHLAAVATGDHQRQRTAENAIITLLNDTAQLDRIDGAGLCHGLAGVVHTAWTIADDASNHELDTALVALTERRLSRPSALPADPEFLDGIAGVALALHTVSTGTAPRTRWDSCLLLA